MNRTLVSFGLLLLAPLLHAKEGLLRNFGSHELSGDGYSVRIELERVAEGALAPRITFREKGKLATAGIGKGSSMPVVPNRWAAEFRPPNELWIYDGKGGLMLYERTTAPNGFKASSSEVVPELHERAPAALKKVISESHSETQNKPNQATQ
jgi:hypothetical protein